MDPFRSLTLVGTLSPVPYPRDKVKQLNKNCSWTCVCEERAERFRPQEEESRSPLKDIEFLFSTALPLTPWL